MDDNTKSCCLEEVAFKWMFHGGILQSLQEQCQRNENERTACKMKEKKIYRIVFTIDVGELLEFDVQLGNLVCNQPEDTKDIFQEACFTCIQTLNWIPQIRTKTQIDLQLRYLSIPRFISCSSVFALRRELLESGSRSMPLFCTIGLVTSMTSKVNYTQSTWFQCLNNYCCTLMKNGRAGSSNSTGVESLSGEKICSYCGTPLEEDISCRVLGERCLLRIVSPDGLSNNSLGCHIYRSISVCVRDELINEIQLGSCYSFSLIPLREFYGGQNSNELGMVFEANNVTKISGSPVLPMVPQSFLKVKSNFGQIQRLYEDRKSSPWSFAASLAYFFGDSITPPGTYFRLKLGLLLSLVSQEISHHEDQLSPGHVHILTVSKDVLPLQRLLLYSKSFAKRSVVFSQCNDLCYSVTKDQSRNASCIIHGGCVLLASDGVCVLSNLNELKNDQIQELENVMETEYVKIDIPKKYIGCQQSQISVPVTCKIWACCEIKKQGAKSHYSTYQNLQEYGQSLSKALVDYFGLVFVMMENETTASSETLAENLMVKTILGKACEVKEQENYRISESEFSQFLQYAARTEPSFSNEAQELIQGFYLASRRARSSSGVAEFPIAALKSMMSLAEAHAKLSLRAEVLENDAIMAILLYEESLTARVGYSVLGIIPLHHFKDKNIMTYIGEENDQKMIHLKMHIKRFCSLHSNYKYNPGYASREE